MEAVLEAFASERLLTLAADTVEISHEVLLTAWPLLRDTWLAETHADRIVRTRLHNAAADWARRSRDPSYLYSGSLLEDAATTAARISADPVRYPPLSQTERDFIGASERVRHRRVRRRQGIIAFLMVLVVGFASAAFLAARANQETARELDAALSGQLITQSEALGETDPILAKKESLAAWQIDQANPAARYAMLTAARLPGTGVLTQRRCLGRCSGVQPRREDPRHGQQSRPPAAVGRGHSTADRRSARHTQPRQDRFGGVQPGRQDRGHSWPGRHHPAVGRGYSPADRQAPHRRPLGHLLHSLQPGRQTCWPPGISTGPSSCGM